VTGKHLAVAARENYTRPASFALWLMAELAIIGSDIQEVSIFENES
jgi:Mn2+/Fe2+ NRAMP family transporter